jgi:hypothetical protein
MKLRRLMQIAHRAKAYQGGGCASQQNWPPDVRFGSGADIAYDLAIVFFTPESGQIADKVSDDFDPFLGVMARSCPLYRQSYRKRR